MKKIFWILFVIVVLILISVGYHKSLNSNDVGSGDNINEPLNDQIQGLPTSGEKEVLVENDTKELDDDVKNADKIEETNQAVKEDVSKVSGEAQTEKIETMAGAYSSYDNKKNAWGFVRKPDGKTPEFYGPHAKVLDDYEGIYIGNTEEPVIYLTFDEGYENGYTEKILDVLKETEVPAAFFVVKPYITQNPDIIKRMNDEGHLVCNHSSHHPSMASITDPVKFKQEFTDVEDAYKEVCGSEMPKFFRPPMGKYSINSLKQTQELGYKSIFWSFAYKDWIIDNQPSEDMAIKKITNGVHPGCIMLLHAVSKTNTNVLKTVIEQIKNDGYEFKSLNDLPSCNRNDDSSPENTDTLNNM